MNRQLICLALLLCGLLCGNAIAQNAAAAEPDEPVAPIAAGSEEPEAPAEADIPAEMPLVSIPLQRNLRFTLRPTILGLIPPDSAENYGEGLVRVTALSGRRVELHYEIKEEIEKERGGDQLFELQEAPVELRTEFLTRFRRGDIVVTDMTEGQRISCPLFWGEGDMTAADYGLLWINPDLLAQLSSAGSCVWDVNCAANTDEEMARQLGDLIAAHRKVAGVAADASVQLELIEAEGRYIVPVNGEMSQLAAVHARDSLGMAEYWFLADPANPLLLKMSFIASPDASPDRDGMTRQMLVGTGFAITSINF